MKVAVIIQGWMIHAVSCLNAQICGLHTKLESGSRDEYPQEQCIQALESDWRKARAFFFLWVKAQKKPALSCSGHA